MMTDATYGEVKSRRKAQMLGFSFALSFIIAFCTPTTAYAGTYSNFYSGVEVVGFSTTLKYTNNHAGFNLKLENGKFAGIFNFLVNDSYTIKMYNNSGKLVWSGNASGVRTFWIGSNVTKIVIDRPFSSTMLFWSKV